MTSGLASPASPLVSVVIPTKDRRELLMSGGLRAALDQVDVELEVVVVDDGSVDGTREALAAVPDPRVRVIRHERSRGVAAARNAGLTSARGRWIAFLDDDDLWSPAKLATQLAALHSAGASFAYSGVVVLDEAGAPTEIMHAPDPSELRAALLQRNCMPAGSSNIIASVDTLRAVGGFDEELAYLADWDLWLKLARSASAAAVPDVHIAYVRHDARMVLRRREAVAELARLRARHRGDGFRPDGDSFLSWVAGEHRRSGRRLSAVAVYAHAAVAYRRPHQLTRIVATALDSRGAGVKRIFGGHSREQAAVPAPDWLAAR